MPSSAERTALRAMVCGRSSLAIEIVRSVLEAEAIAVTARAEESGVAVMVDPTPDDWDRLPETIGSVVFVTTTLDDDVLIDAVGRGADAVVDLSDATTHVVPAIRAVAVGHSVFSPRQARLVAEAFRRASGVDAIHLTRREYDILGSIELGHSVKQTARHLGISPKTVENLQSRLFRKLGVRNRAQAVTVAHRAGLLVVDDPVGEPA